MKKPLKGLVLIGGHSTRMGKDKAFLRYHNKAQFAFLYDLLSKYCEEVFISCRAEQVALLPSHYPILVDVFENIGALSGLLSAFQHDDATAWLVLACDLPFIDDKTLQFLLQNRQPEKAATIFYNSETQFFEPLVAVWEKESYVILKKNFEIKKYSLNQILKQIPIETVTLPNPNALKNVNHKWEYEAIKANF